MPAGWRRSEAERKGWGSGPGGRPTGRSRRAESVAGSSSGRTAGRAATGPAPHRRYPDRPQAACAPRRTRGTTHERGDSGDERQRRHRPQKKPGLAGSDPPAVALEQDQRKGDDEDRALEPGQERTGRGRTGHGSPVGLGLPRMRPSRSREEAFRVRHQREDGTERGTGRGAPRQNRAKSRLTAVLPKPDEQKDRPHERGIGQGDRDQAGEVWPREGKDANQEREERQERIVVVAIDDRLDVIAVADDAQVPPAVPRGQAAENRSAVAGGQRGGLRTRPFSAKSGGQDEETRSRDALRRPPRRPSWTVMSGCTPSTRRAG